MTRNTSHSDARREREISRTAIWVAAARAIGAREPDPTVRNPDRLAERLLGDPAKLGLDHPVVDALRSSYEEAMRDMETAGLVRAMTERTRFIDEALERAIRAGATQVLIPGAGFDSHAYRCRELLARVAVFEVDRPATLAFKQRRVAEALGTPPAHLTYVPLDLEHDELPVALARHGYDVSRRTFVILEGVTMYVPEEELRALFRFVASHPPGSGIVFDFATRTMVDGIKHIDLAAVPPMARPSLERFLDLIKDEPWLFGFPVGGEEQFLAELGLSLREVLTIGSEEAARRYLTRADGTTLGAEGHAKGEALRKAAQVAAAEHASADQREKLAQRMREQERHMAYRIAEAAVSP
jgi:methyltransferase (TIGR00027 family)